MLVKVPSKGGHPDTIFPISVPRYVPKWYVKPKHVINKCSAVFVSKTPERQCLHGFMLQLHPSSIISFSLISSFLP